MIKKWMVNLMALAVGDLVFEKLGEEGVKKLLESDFVRGIVNTKGGAPEGANGSGK
jgi:hypothetical protein